MSMYDAIVLHSGGMDSSICLALSVEKFGASRVLSLGFSYQQRHRSELKAAETMADFFGVKREIIDIPVLSGWNDSSLLDHHRSITTGEQGIPNSFVPGRNSLFLLVSAVFARKIGVHRLYLGVMEREGAFSGYPDCRRSYVDLVQELVRLDIQDPHLLIETPLISMTKAETMEVAYSLGVLEFLLCHAISCYHGIDLLGCRSCPACQLRNEGIRQWAESHPDYCLPVPFQSLRV